MNKPVLTSKANPLVQKFRLAATRVRRAPPELVVAEGLRVLEEAVKARCPIEAVLVADVFGSDARGLELLARWSELNIPVRRASAAVLKAMSEVVSPQGALALVRVPIHTLSDLADEPNPLILCLDGIQDPGNLGTLLRTARAAGASRVFSVAGSVSARNPKAIRASAGAFFHLPVVEGLRPAQILDYCRARRIPMYKADVKAEAPCWDADLAGSAAIVLGNEARGLTDGDWDALAPIKIPMATGVESLNVAAAGAILLYEALRQRLAAALPSSREAK